MEPLASRSSLEVTGDKGSSGTLFRCGLTSDGRRAPSRTPPGWDPQQAQQHSDQTDSRLSSRRWEVLASGHCGRPPAKCSSLSSCDSSQRLNVAVAPTSQMRPLRDSGLPGIPGGGARI